MKKMTLLGLLLVSTLSFSNTEEEKEEGFVEKYKKKIITKVVTDKIEDIKESSMNFFEESSKKIQEIPNSEAVKTMTAKTNEYTEKFVEGTDNLNSWIDEKYGFNLKEEASNLMGKKEEETSQEENLNS